MTKRSKTKSKAWPELGTLRQKDGGKPYIVLNPSVKVLVGKYNKDTDSYENHEEVDMGDYRTVLCVDPMAGLDALLDGGHITEEEHAKRVELIEQKSVMFKLSVSPSE